MNKHTDRFTFWKRHIAGLDEETMAGLCPSCHNWGFTILWNDQFICLRCPLSGKGIDDFIEKVDAHRLSYLRMNVRVHRAVYALDERARNREDILRKEIPPIVLDAEKKRFHVWEALAGMEEEVRGNLGSLGEVVVLLAEDLGLEREEVQGHLDSLVEFGDIEILGDKIIIGENPWGFRHQMLAWEEGEPGAVGEGQEGPGATQLEGWAQAEMDRGEIPEE